MLTKRLEVAAADRIALRVADEITELVEARRARGRSAVLALPAGSSPRGVYAELARRHRDGLRLDNVTVFALDEYLGLASAHPQSFRRFFESELVRGAGLPAENLNVPDGDLHPNQVQAHCADYERSIAAAGGIDLALVGIGVNGHVGFNEPGSPVDSRTRCVELHASSRARAAEAFGGLERVPTNAITMGLGTIREARAIRMIATGAAKREVLGRVIDGQPDQDVPASLLATHPDFAIYADAEAAPA